MSNKHFTEAQSILDQHDFNSTPYTWELGPIALVTASTDIEKVIQFYAGFLGQRKLDDHLPIHGFILWKIYQQHTGNEIFIKLIKDLHPILVQHHKQYYQDQNPLENGMIPTLSTNHVLKDELPFWVHKDQNVKDKHLNQIVDPLFNSLLSVSNESLIELGYALDLDSADLFELNEQTIHSMNEILWNKERGLYDSFDTSSAKTFQIESALGFIPLVAGIPDIDQVLIMVRHVFGDDFRQEGHYSIPFFSYDHTDYRGDKNRSFSISLIINWLLIEGLRRYEMEDLAEIVIDDSLELLNRFPFCENFDSDKNELDNGAVSSTSPLAAAMYLDLLAIQS